MNFKKRTKNGITFDAHHCDACNGDVVLSKQENCTYCGSSGDDDEFR